jgi:hypothetical protein
LGQNQISILRRPSGDFFTRNGDFSRQWRADCDVQRELGGLWLYPDVMANRNRIDGVTLNVEFVDRLNFAEHKPYLDLVTPRFLGTSRRSLYESQGDCWSFSLGLGEQEIAYDNFLCLALFAGNRLLRHARFDSPGTGTQLFGEDLQAHVIGGLLRLLHPLGVFDADDGACCWNLLRQLAFAGLHQRIHHADNAFIGRQIAVLNFGKERRSTLAVFIFQKSEQMRHGTVACEAFDVGIFGVRARDVYHIDYRELVAAGDVNHPLALD